MTVVRMVVVGIKMGHQCRDFYQLPQKWRKALRKQGQGEEYGDAIFHAATKLENSKGNRVSLAFSPIKTPKHGHFRWSRLLDLAYYSSQLLPTT